MSKTTKSNKPLFEAKYIELNELFIYKNKHYLLSLDQPNNFADYLNCFEIETHIYKSIPLNANIFAFIKI